MFAAAVVVGAFEVLPVQTVSVALWAVGADGLFEALTPKEEP